MITSPLASPGGQGFASFPIIDLLVVKADKIPNISAMNDEDGISQHSDSDDVVDFDEDNRFNTERWGNFVEAEHPLDKTTADSDGDGGSRRIWHVDADAD